MAVNTKELRDYIERLTRLQEDAPNIIGQIAVSEGMYAVGQARKSCTTDLSEPGRRKTGIVNTGDYRRNWKSDKTARQSGNRYFIRVYNNLDYAKHLEYGFRSHFVPGHWAGHTFVYNRGDPAGGMYVGPPGGYVRGHFVLKRAVKRMKDTQQARVKRKIYKAIRQRMEPQ